MDPKLMSAADALLNLVRSKPRYTEYHSYEILYGNQLGYADLIDGFKIRTLTTSPT